MIDKTIDSQMLSASSRENPMGRPMPLSSNAIPIRSSVMRASTRMRLSAYSSGEAYLKLLLTNSFMTSAMKVAFL